MHTRQLFWLLLLVFTPSIFLAQQSLTLKDAISKAVQNSPALQKQLLELQKNDWALKEFKSQYLPTVNGSLQLTFNPALPVQQIPNFFGGNPDETIGVRFGTFQSHQALISIGQLIYSKSYQVGKETVSRTRGIAELSQEQVRENVAYQTAKLYYQVQLLQSQKENLKANQSQLESLLKVSVARERNGLGLKIDTDRITVNKNNLDITMQNLLLQEQQLVDLLHILMGSEPGTPLQLTDMVNTAPQVTVPEFKTDYASSSTIRLLAKQRELTAMGIDQIRAGNYPTVSAFGQLGGLFQGDGFDDFSDKNRWSYNLALGLQVKVPIYNGGIVAKQVEQKKIELQQIEQDRRSAEIGLKQQFVSARTTLANNINRIKPLEENRALAERVSKLTDSRYQEGLANLTEVVDAQKSLTEARNNLAEAWLQIQLAQIDLIQADGKILELTK